MDKPKIVLLDTTNRNKRIPIYGLADFIKKIYIRENGAFCEDVARLNKTVRAHKKSISYLCGGMITTGIVSYIYAKVLDNHVKRIIELEKQVADLYEEVDILNDKCLRNEKEEEEE